jgi:hypothetical protein
MELSADLDFLEAIETIAETYTNDHHFADLRADLQSNC